MKNYLVIFIAWCLFGAAHAQVTYTPTAGNYTTKTDYTSCPGGETCTNYTTAMNASGSFTLSTALAPSSSFADLSSSVTAYSFSDGINTYSNTNPNDRIYRLSVTTNAAGDISTFTILIEKWLSGTNGAHVASNKFSYIFLTNATTQVFNNRSCGNVAASPFTSVADTCTQDLGGTGSSSATGPAATINSVAPQQSAQAIPTLSEWAMIILASLMALCTTWYIKRQR